MHQLLTHLSAHKEPIRLLRKASESDWSDKDLHNESFQNDPQNYALLALAPDLNQWQRARILLQILRSSRKDQDISTCALLELTGTVLAALLPADIVIKVFLTLRRERANHKHASRAIMHYLCNHANKSELVASRRHAIIDCVEHALGKNVARTINKPPDSRERKRLNGYLRRYGLGSEALVFLQQMYTSVPENQSAEPAYRQAHDKLVSMVDKASRAPKTVTPTNRGDIAATLVHSYRGSAASVTEALNEYVQSCAETLPSFHGRLALIVDASISMSGYGERQYSILSQAIALQMVLQKSCKDLTVFTTGGTGSPPQPDGTADLAETLLKALTLEPELILIVSDGYENTFEGDLHLVASHLKQFGVHTPIVFCHSKFSPADDLRLRRPTDSLPQLEFWHEDEFEKLMLTAFMLSDPGKTTLTNFLTAKLTRLHTCMKTSLPDIIVDAVVD